MPKTITVTLWIPSVAQRQATVRLGVILPVRMTAGESVNFKTALKSPYLSLQI